MDKNSWTIVSCRTGWQKCFEYPKTFENPKLFEYPKILEYPNAFRDPKFLEYSTEKNLINSHFNFQFSNWIQISISINNYIRSFEFIKFTFNQLIIKICNIGDLTYGTIDEHYSNLLKCNDPIESKFKAVGHSALPDWYDEKLFKA